VNISEEVERLFHELVSLTPAERGDYFQRFRTDPQVRESVEALLHYDDGRETLFDELIHDQAVAAFFRGNDAAGGSPMVCGPYLLLELIGQGGMAKVWLARRSDGMPNRPVALKLPYAGLHREHFSERTHREREILAALNHPGIARLYDAGVTNEGQPYLALEYIEGCNLTAYCDQRRLPIRDRLVLFKQVLTAVQYAHSHLVIHRDLKPSNILVTESGEVKLLDFGIAKLLVEGEARETELTQIHGRALTPAYASPEQLEARAVSTASDIYSLGMILYELLAGGSPYSLKRDTRGALEEAVLFVPPRRPSSVADDSAASARSTTKSRLAAALRGDLDTILLKALQKAAEERYATADAFRADIESYLTNKPVLAQPESRLYRARKFLLRNRVAVLSVCSIFLALAVGLGVALWQAQIARREARTAQAVQQFTEDIFQTNSREQRDPVKAQQTTARQLLEIGTRKIDRQLTDVPAAKLRMLEMLADLTQNLGLNDDAVRLERKRVELAKKTFGATDPRVADALIDLASGMHASRAVNEREKVLMEAQAILDRNHDDRSKIRASLLNGFAEHYESSDLPKSLENAKKAVAIYRLFPPSPELAEALYLQSMASLSLQDFVRAEAPMTEAILLSKRFHGDPNADLPRFYAYKSEVEENLFRFQPAEDSIRQAYLEARAVSGDDDVDTFETGSRLGLLLVKTGRPHEGLHYLEQAKNSCLKSRGADDPFYMPIVLYQYGFGLVEFGRLREGLDYIDQAIANRRKNRPGTVFLAVMLEYKAGILVDLGRYAEAHSALSESISISEKVGRNAEPSRFNAELKLALALKRADEAEALMNRLHPPVPAKDGELSADMFRNLYQRSEVALLTNDADTAIQYSSRGLTAVTSNSQRQYCRRWETRARLVLARGFLLRRASEQALPLLLKVKSENEELLAAESPEQAMVDALLGICYLDTGDRALARRYLDESHAIELPYGKFGDHFARPIRDLEARLRIPPNPR
jgi:eukaryotic-like serine/threonine-protein kinase